MDLFELATINNAELQKLIRERDKACDMEDLYRFDCEMYQAMGDSNTAAMYEHLANCEMVKALDLCLQIGKLAEGMGL